MFATLSKYRDVVAVVVCLLVPSVVLYAQSRSDAEAGPAVRTIVRLTAPLQDLMSWVVEGLSDTWEEHWQNARSIDDARRIRIEVAHLRRIAERLDEVERENGRLRALLNAAPTPGGAKVIGARVVAVGASPVYRTVRVDVGRGEGVQRGMAVIAAEGAMGAVLRTGHGYSDVLLITDRQSAVDVVLPRSGARGILKGPGGEGEALLRLEGLDRSDDVRAEDVVIASGLGARFPRGTNVGTVVSVETVEGSLSQTALVRPIVAFTRVRNVLVVLQQEETSAAWAGPSMTPEKVLPAAVAAAAAEASTAAPDAGKPPTRAAPGLVESPPAWVNPAGGRAHDPATVARPPVEPAPKPALPAPAAATKNEAPAPAAPIKPVEKKPESPPPAANETPTSKTTAPPVKPVEKKPESPAPPPAPKASAEPVKPIEKKPESPAPAAPAPAQPPAGGAVP